MKTTSPHSEQTDIGTHDTPNPQPAYLGEDVADENLSPNTLGKTESCHVSPNTALFDESMVVLELSEFGSTANIRTVRTAAILFGLVPSLLLSLAIPHQWFQLTVEGVARSVLLWLLLPLLVSSVLAASWTILALKASISFRFNVRKYTSS